MMLDDSLETWMRRRVEDPKFHVGTGLTDTLVALAAEFDRRLAEILKDTVPHPAS